MYKMKFLKIISIVILVFFIILFSIVDRKNLTSVDLECPADVLPSETELKKQTKPAKATRSAKTTADITESTIKKPEELQTKKTIIYIPERGITRAEALNFPKSTIMEPEELQIKRWHMIARLIQDEIFDRIEMPGTLPYIWVKPSFMNLDFRTKSAFVEIVYAYYFDRPGRKQSEIWGDTVIIKDFYTGREIGSFSLVNCGNPFNLNKKI